jgi:deazaflavin-dependent oxidoreductase (nitroreductase family)
MWAGITGQRAQFPSASADEREVRLVANEVGDFNGQIIEQFRANAGQVGGNFDGAPLLLLHTTGAKTGRERITPVVYLADGDRYVVFGSKAGADTNPDWYHNLLAHPATTIEVGPETVDVTARVAEGDERARLWRRQKEVMPGFAEYERKTSRPIPVVVLERVA